MFLFCGNTCGVLVEGKEKRRVQVMTMIAVLRLESVIRGAQPVDEDDDWIWLPSLLCVCG